MSINQFLDPIVAYGVNAEEEGRAVAEGLQPR